MERFIALIKGSEDWLIGRVLQYARERGYTKYTSTLQEAWRLSISGLSASLLSIVEKDEIDLELTPEEDFSEDPAASFGVKEARLHRERGVSLGMFLGLMKYYRQSYIDLVMQSEFDEDYKSRCLSIVDRFFDRTEIGFCIEWSESAGSTLVSELQSANRAMTNEKNKYLTAFESIPNPVIIVDRDNCIENMNYAASLLLCDSAVPGSEYYRMLEDDRENNHTGKKGEPIDVFLPWITDELEEFHRSGETERRFEKRLYMPRGEQYIHTRLARMLDVSGKFSGSVIVLEDITRRKQAEEQLLRGQRMAAVAVLAGGVAHEFNNALAGISGNLELLQITLPDDENVVRYGERMRVSTHRMVHLTNQLLGYARKGKYKPVPICLNDLVKDAVPLIRHSIDTAIRIEMDVTLDTLHIRADLTQMQMVLMGILTNAAEAIEGGGRIRITARKAVIDEVAAAEGNIALRPGTYACLTIKDNGRGMDEETLSRIFEPFYTTKFQGRGLGMSAAQGIVENHGGVIAVSSEPGNGTVVRLYLPTIEAPKR